MGTEKGENTRGVGAVDALDLLPASSAVRDAFLHDISELYDQQSFTSSPIEARLEADLAALSGCSEIVLMGSGTMALHCAAVVLGIESGDEIVVPGNTIAATAQGLSRTGAKVVAAEVDPNSWLISRESVREAISDRTSAICAVHLYGNVVDVPSLEEYGVPIIEDCAHALGAQLGSRFVGELGVISAFSTGPTKTFGGIGQGGFLATNRKEFADLIRTYIHNGQRSKHYAIHEGHNFLPNPAHDLLVARKIERATEVLRHQREILDSYRASFRDTAVIVQARTKGSTPAPWIAAATVPTELRDLLISKLGERNINLSMGYIQHAIQAQPFYSVVGARREELRIADNLSESLIALPTHEGIDRPRAVALAEEILNTLARLNGAGA